MIQALAEHDGGGKAEAAKALPAVVRTITMKTAAGEKVSITGFEIFEKVPRGEPMVRNPGAGERKLAEPTAVPRFRPGTDLKAYVSGAKQLPDVEQGNQTAQPEDESTAPASREPASSTTVTRTVVKSAPSRKRAGKKSDRRVSAQG